MSQNNVTYSITLTPENAPKIDAINRIMLGADYTAEAPAPEKKPSEASKPSSPSETETADTSSSVTLEDVKNAAKAAKKDHGEEFAMQVLKDNDVDVKSSLGRSMSAIPEDKYEMIIEMWETGPVQQQDDDLPEDDSFDDEDDGFDDDDTPTVESVQAALKAYSKEKSREEAKEIMQKHGATALSKVADCTSAQLIAMMKELA